MEDFAAKVIKEMEEFGNRLARYEAEYASTSSRLAADTHGSESVAVSVPTFFADQKEQANQLKEMRIAFSNLKKMVDRLQNKVEDQEQKLDDLKQYARSNCLIIHRCEEVPKRGEYLEHEKYVCGLLNLNLKLIPPLQVNDIDIAHPLPAENNNCPVIVKFLRSQRNYIFSQKRLLKGKQMIITESFTKRRLQLLEAARDVFGWRSVWSFNGYVYAFAGGKKQVIRNLNDIVEIKNSM